MYAIRSYYEHVADRVLAILRADETGRIELAQPGRIAQQLLMIEAGGRGDLSHSYNFV